MLSVQPEPTFITVIAWITFVASVLVSIYGIYLYRRQFVEVFKRKHEVDQITWLSLMISVLSLCSALFNHVSFALSAN